MRLTARLSIALAVVGVTLGLGAAPRAQGPAPGSEALDARCEAASSMARRSLARRSRQRPR